MGNLWHLPEDERARVYWMLEWIGRMGDKYGSTVYEKNGKSWDWGQALCRECYGPHWNFNPALPESPTQDDVIRAEKWEQGDIPDWVENDWREK